MSNKNTLIVYYREGCHLCEQMTATLYEQQQQYPQLNIKIKIIDIDDDPALREKYNVDVPVVMYQGEVAFYHFFDKDEFEQILTTMKNS